VLLPAPMMPAMPMNMSVRIEAVDSNGVLPLRAADRPFTTAASFRRHLHKTLSPHLLEVPLAEPLAGVHPPEATVAAEVLSRWAPWPARSPGARQGLDLLPINQTVGACSVPGGPVAGGRALDGFIGGALGRYADERSDPDANAQSGLSPYLHWGHISAHEVVGRIFERSGFDVLREVPAATGSREGWWGLEPDYESFLDEMITWRELGYGFSFHRPDDYDRYDSLPDWARQTLAEHAVDPRPKVYDIAGLEAGRTHDRLWNAAQNQLRHEGRIHNYLRMLWGKKILEWSPTPEAALAALIELNNKYAIDGRNPNSYSGIFWTLGRFDRPWGPVRPIFGTIRYMTSDSAAKKLKLKDYLRTWA
jgi:deoxyribodipyrimidine photo-lyase